MAQAEPVFDVPTLSARLKRGVIGGGEDRARQRCDEVARDGDAIAFAPPDNFTIPVRRTGRNTAHGV